MDGIFFRVTINLPDHLPGVRDLSEREIIAELAVSLYAGKRLTLVQAADLAGMGLFSFQKQLQEHGVPQHYDEAAFMDDLACLETLPK
jgi:predicted HTH domain antitoxin